MAYEDGYISQLNLGSKAALESALPPPGIRDRQQRLDRVLPGPPPGYAPGPLSPIRMEREDAVSASPFKKFADGFVYGATGHIPLDMKMKMLQQDAFLKESEHKMAWDNYYKNNEVVRSTLESHSRDAQKDFLNILPNIKAQISSIVDPEQRRKLADHWATTAEAMSPGSGAFVKFFHDNQASVYSSDALLSDPDPSISGPALEMQRRMGYPEAVMSKEWTELSRIQNRDRVNSISARMPLAIRQKMADGKMGENEFRVAFKDAMLEAQLRPVTMAAAQAFLDTDQGQGVMVGLGVETNALLTAKGKKEKPDDYLTVDKKADYDKHKAIVEFARLNPGVIPESTVQDAQLRLDRHMQLASKESSPGQFSENNPLGAALLSVSGGKYSDPKKMLEGIPVGTAEHSKRLDLLDKALRKNAELKPLAGNEAKLEMLKDLNKEPVFTLDKKGNLQRVKGPMTQREYLSQNNQFTMTADQRTKMTDLVRDEATGRALFDDADKAFTATDAPGKAAELAAESAVSGFLNHIPGAAAISAEKYPEIYNYVSRKDAALGRYAKSLGGEAGVLTDQDIARVQRMFDTASDTKKTRAAKRKAFQQIIDINRTAITSLLTAKKETDEDGQLTKADFDSVRDTYKDRINGVLGSVEDLANRDKQALKKEPGTSLAEPSQPTVTRGESLLERMRNKAN